ncbi:MAG TPA: hypothetical protein VIL20_00530 [Sandaracinaceae bacterium]
MDPRTHRRYLEYVEKHQYFCGSRVARLTREEWLELDRELGPLREKAARDALTANELTRLEALRRILLVD